jgi:glycosyltransferase involved in cell wall biosynthesis
VAHPVYDMFESQRVSKGLARQQLGLPQEAMINLFFGIVRPYKGLSVLLQAISVLKNDSRKFYLVVAGEFWEDIDKYSLQIEQLGLQDCIRIDNRYIPNEDVPKYFSAADIFAAPYISGTQSGAVKMAFGFGLPVVASDAIAEENWSDSPSIQIFPSGDENALAKCLASEKVLQKGPGVQGIPDSGWEELVQAIESLARAIK